MPLHTITPTASTRRQGERAREQRIGLDQLLDECADEREQLDAAVFAVRHIDHAIIRDAQRVHDAELGGPGAVKSVLRMISQ